MQQAFPVSVLAEYQPTPANRWQAGRWVVTGVVAADPLTATQPVRSTPVHRDGAESRVIWSGFTLELHKDDVESYYYNIISDTPRIFVICNIDADEPLRPLLVTMSYDEAASYMESDESVESVAMPAELYRFVERFVLEHYVPEKKKKRKRERWKEDENGRPPGH